MLHNAYNKLHILIILMGLSGMMQAQTNVNSYQPLPAPISNHVINSASITKPNNINAVTNTPKCLTDEVSSTFVQQQLAATPGYQNSMDKQQVTLKNWAQNYLQNKNGMVVRTIPVVVHVVYNPSNSNSPDENVPDSYIYDMINILNEDFRRLNADAAQTRSQFQGVAADAEIEFCLASKDPNGGTTTGITRTSTTEGYFNPDTETNKMKDDGTNGKTGWDATKYLNIWICNISNYANSGTAGYAYLPTPGMHGSSIDGLVIDFKLGIYYGDGRTTTHEIGHYLGLKHTWGNNPPSCNDDDGFSDTPNSSSENYGCNYSANTCAGGDVDQIENYMSYASCQNMYSVEQAAHMNSVLTNTRSSLLSSDGCEPTAAPTADFVADKTTVPAGGWVTFTDLSTGVPDTWSWVFGGGGTPNTSSTRDPVIQFNTIGTYMVILTVTNSLGTDTESKAAYITVTAPTGCDTINWGFLTDTAIYTYNCGPTCGFVIGTNQYDDQAKAQQFSVSEYAPNTHVTGGLFYFGYAYKAPGSNAQVVFKVWDSDGTAGAPGTVLGTDTVDLADIASDVQGNYLTQTLFNPPVRVTGDFFFGFEMLNFDLWTGGTRDSLSLTQTLDGVMAGSNVWEYSDLGSGYDWYDFSTAWGMTTTMFATPYMTTLTPTPMFTSDVQTGCEGTTVTFDAGASTNANAYYWDVDGDGTYDWYTIDSILTITYDTTGTFDVRLLVEGPCTGINDTVFSNYITINPKPSLTTTETDASCGACDGLGSVTASGASTPYTYSWNDPGTSTSTSISGLCPGSYQVNVTDANGCTDIAGINISDPASMAVSTSSTNANCGNTDGTATATVTGGTAPLTYQWDDAGSQAAQTATGLGAGTYSVTVTDGNGCTVETDFFGAAVVSSTAAVSSSISSSSNPSCNGTGDGTATVAPSGGDGNFTYSWNTTPAQSNATATGLSGGLITATVTDGNGCTSSSSVTLNEPAAISISTSTTDATCGNSDGTATVTVISGGVTPLTYSWSNGGSGTTISSLSAATYSVTVTDANGCTVSSSANVSDAGAPSASASSTDASCNGGSDGTATVNASGGSAPYTYSWSSGQTTSSVTGLSANTYSVTVTDGTGCSASASTTVSEPTAISITLSSSDENCSNSDGTASASASGGTGSLTYSWSSGPTSTSISGLSAGTYSVTVSDANGCTSNSSTTINNTAGVSISATGSDETCSLSNGSATVTTSGGTSPFTYLWSNGQTTSTATGLAANTYTVDVTDANGCTDNTSVTISNTAGPSVTTTSTDASCGNSNGTGTATVTGGTAPFTYLWSDGQTTSSVSGLAANTYTVDVTDANGCTANGSVTIIDAGGPSVTTTATDVTCNGGLDGTASAVATGGSAPYGYDWSDGQNTSSASGLIAGTYTVTVTDSAGCTITDSATVNEPVAVTGSVTTTSTVTGAACTGTATAVGTGGTGTLSYSWSDPASQTNATATGLCAGTYTVTITDANNCIATASGTVDEVTGLNEIQYGFTMNLFPNPTNGWVKMELMAEKPQDVSIMVFNTLGELIWEKSIQDLNTTTIELDLSPHSNGIYFIRFKTDNFIDTRKISLVR